MLGYVKYKQPYVTWHPPHWPLWREIQVGEEVSRFGKAHLRKKFCDGHWLPKVDPPDTPTVNKVHSNGPYGFTAPPTAGTYPGHDQTPKRKPWWSAIFVFAFYVLLFVGGAAALIFAWPVGALGAGYWPLLGIIIYLWYLASLGLAVARFTHWLNRCEACYKAIQATSGGEPHVIACHYCNQNIRFPARIGSLRIRCPACCQTFSITPNA